MSLSRVIFVVASVLLLEACGFSPLYSLKGGNVSPVERKFALLDISPMKDRVGQQLHNLILNIFIIHVHMMN